MDDGGKQTHTFGSGQQRTQHPRPFFYVQPPSQPYYQPLYQPWHLNNPYSHYGLPGGFNFGRPCMHPYQYMQYPGFVFPHAPIYPMDHRRMFEPRFHTPTWSDMPRQQYHPQPPGRREMACSEAQTDPSDAITKLIECLDKIRGGELQGAERELDSGVASQTSGMFSPGEEKKGEELGHVLPLVSDSSHLESPPVTFSDSTTAVYDGDSSQRSLEGLSPQGCWSGGLEEELPLDSSSIHEECLELVQPATDECFLPLEKAEVTDIQSDISVTDPKCAEELLKQRLDPIQPSTPSLPAHRDAKGCDKVSKTEHQKTDQNYQILKLPFETVLTPGGAGAGHLSSPAAPYYYNYLSMHTTHERMSVLSPSLDELSSRDELFSTDLDDADLFPKHVYAGRRLAEVVSGSPKAAEEVEDVWLPGSKRFMCACCGKSLTKGASRSKVHSSKMYRDEAGDSEDDSRYGRGCEQPVRVVVRKHSAPRRPHSVPLRHAAKPWYKRGQYKDPSDPVNQEEGHDLCKQEPEDGDVGEMTSSELQCRTCQDRLCKEDVAVLDQGRWEDNIVIPRRRPPTSLQRQEMSTQRKVMYHRPRDEDNDDDELPPLHWERDMDAATSTMQHSYGLGPRGPNPPHGAQQAQGLHQPTTGPSGAPHPEEQQHHHHHHKPFFYIQPSQPYMPMQSLQWPVPVPMPVSYNPYYGYPGLGFGLPVMPNYQPNPYMEPPGFVVPHTHLHLMDYRRMLNPQYYQTMAYHSRRFRYQQNGQPKEMTSSEVQTEPLPATKRTSTAGSSDGEATRGLQVHSNSPSVPNTSQSLSPASAVHKGDHSLELKDSVPSSTTVTSPNGSFVIQTEEVRIECCTTPVGLQLLHSHETAEVAHTFSQDVVQCSSILQGQVLQDKGLCLPADQSEQALQACPDILLVGTPSSGEKIPALEEPRSQTDPVTTTSNCGSQVAVHGDVQETSSEKELSRTSQSFHFKVVHLPFDPKYLDELRKMESTVWSMEDTLIPSPESLIQSGHTESRNETLAADMPSTDELMVNEEAPTEEVIPIIEMPPLTEDELQVPAVKAPVDELLSEADNCPMVDVPVVEETPMSTAEVTHAPYLLLLDNSPLNAGRNQKRRETNVQDHQDTSFESLPAYLPSTSWLADFDNVYYCSKLPPTPKKQRKPLSSCSLDVPSRRRKLELEYKEHPTIRKPKERYKPKGKVDRQSLSDHECLLNRKLNENAFTPYASKRERLCTRCLAKCRICMSAGPALEGQTLKRKAVPFQQMNDALLLTCETCRSHSNKQPRRKASSPDVRDHHRHDTESSENSSCRTGPKWRSADDPRKLNDPKRPLASKQNLEKCPAASYPKLREKNYLSNEPQYQSVPWERLCHCPHGNAIREMDENCAMPNSLQDKWRNMDPIYPRHRWQTDKSWKAATPSSGVDSFKNETRSQHLNKHKKSQPQAQGTRRKDTRC